MDEKKVEMTDEEIAEEIVKALVNTKKSLEDLHEDDDDYDKLSLLKKINNSSLWLIQRLQGENADLNVKNATLEHENSELKQRVSILEADNDDYKNKIAENELVSIDWHYSQVEDLEEEKMRLGHRLSETQYSLSVCQDVNAEQKAEIERLTEENVALQKGVNRLKKRYEEAIKQNADEVVKKFCETTMYVEQERLVKEKAELQKQVDELLEQRDVFKNLFENCNNSSITTDEIIDAMNSFYREQAEHLAGLKIEQAIKDTAKEILDELYHKKYDDIEVQVKDYKMHEEAIMIVCKALLKAINERMKNVAERYGVEVE